jgi:aspartate aminotransferase-like enzyme
MADQQCRFFVPGPTWVRPEILAEMTRPMIGHRTAEFRALFHQMRSDLQELFRTKQQTFIVTASGTGLLEGALTNVVPRRVLVTTCGAFGERWLRIAEQLGIEADHLDHPWGQPVDPERLATHFTGRRYHYDAVTITHNETSTGVINDLQALVNVVRSESEDTLVLVDAVSSLGGAPLLFDDWGIDVCLASTQKGIAIPPGLTVAAVSDRAVAAAKKKQYRGTYFDFLNILKQAEEDGAPFTPAISLYFALARQLHHILREEGLETRWGRHVKMRDITIERTAAYADVIPPRTHASPSVSALRPSKMSGRDVVARMKERGFTLGGGYGAWKDDSFRIGHMGDISVEDLSAMLDVLDEVMKD